MEEIQTEEQKTPEAPVQIAQPKTPSEKTPSERIPERPWSDLAKIEPLPITKANNRSIKTEIH